jgi:hypothetical protein
MPNPTEDVVVTDEQLEDLIRGAKTLFKHKQLVEVRLMLKGGKMRGLYFDDHDRMAETVRRLDGHPQLQSIYCIFNPVSPKLLEQRASCACERCQRAPIGKNPTFQQAEQTINGPSQHLTANEEIDSLNWLFIDVDTTRAPGFEHEPSTREEKLAAREVANKVLRYLTDEKKWPQPLLADSGNGYHILCKINMLNTQNSIDMLVDVLKALAAKFNSDAAKIDDSVFNAARLTRFYGTTTRKGTGTTERPYRRNKIYPPQGAIRAVTTDQVIDVGGDAPRGNKARGDMPGLHKDWDAQGFFDWYEQQGAFHITGANTWQGHEIKITDRCISADRKHTGSGLTGFIIGDTFGYHCFSDDCTGITIGDILQKLSEEGYQRYPGKIWVEEDLSNFAEDVSGFEKTLREETLTYAPAAVAVEQAPEKIISEEITEDADVFEALEKTAQRVEPSAMPPPPPKPAQETQQRLSSREPNDLARAVMGIVFRDPEKIRFDFEMYKKRLEKIAPHLEFPVGETLAYMLTYNLEIRKLPTRAELADYINNFPANRGRKNRDKICSFIQQLKDDSSKTFDVTVQALLEEVAWKLEKVALKHAYEKLDGDRDILGFRMALRKHWAASTSVDSDFRPGSWQEDADNILESFRRDVEGTGDERKFKTGFDAIDYNSGMNIGLDGEHAIVICGPASSRKTTAALTLALNFAMTGKRGLILAGEHNRMKIQKRLTLMLSYYLREEVGVIPSLNKWEGINRTAQWADFDALNRVIQELKLMQLVPGHLEVQSIESLTRGEEDRVGSIMNYIDATNAKYQWDYFIIDPLDSIMPPEEGAAGQSNWKQCSSIVDRLFSYTRGFAGDRGIMLVTTAQFNATARREIEKIQQKNGGADNYDDEIAALLRKDSSIQYFTTIGQRFDLCLGVATRVKNGSDGMMVQGRSREGGSFDVMDFRIDENANVILEKDGGVKHTLVGEQTAPQAGATMEGSFDGEL